MNWVWHYACLVVNTFAHAHTCNLFMCPAAFIAGPLYRCGLPKRGRASAPSGCCSSLTPSMGSPPSLHSPSPLQPMVLWCCTLAPVTAMTADERRFSRNELPSPAKVGSWGFNFLTDQTGEAARRRSQGPWSHVVPFGKNNSAELINAETGRLLNRELPLVLTYPCLFPPPPASHLQTLPVSRPEFALGKLDAGGGKGYI